MSDQGFRRLSERRPVALQVRLAYDDRGDFVERYAINISNNGIFIRSREPRPIGSKLKFELHLRTGEIIFAGEGTVRWRQLPDARGLGLSGMGLQFDDLTEESRRLLEEILLAREEERVPEAVEGAQSAAWAPLESFPAPPEPEPLEVNPVSIPPTMAPKTAEGLQNPFAPPQVILPPAIGSGMALGRVRPVTHNVALGIDFGWGSVRVAAGAREKAVVIPLVNGGGIPSFAAWADNDLLIGEMARKAFMAGARGVRGVSQLFGRWPGSPGAASWRKRQLAEPGVGEDGRLGVAFGNKVVSPRLIAERLLLQARVGSEAHLRAPVTRVVFSVPTQWTDAQRHVLRQAANAIGLEVTQFVSAPLASMLACHGARGKRRALAIHFGDGGLEAAIVEQASHVYDLILSVGDSNVGGADMDVLLLESALAQFEEETGFAVPEDASLFERTRAAAAATKELLSDQLEADIFVEKLVDAGLSKAELRQKISRARYLSLVTPLLERAADLARSTMVTRSLKPTDLDEVLLFGAQARLTPFARKIAERVGLEPARPDSANDAAAIGAALIADSMDNLGKFVLAGAVGASVNIGLPGGGTKRLIERNLPLPIERGYTVATTENGQKELSLHLFQGERADAADNEYIGAVVAGPLPPAAKGEMRLNLTVTLDASGLVSVKGRELSSGKPVPVKFDRDRSAESARRELQGSG
jgi:molecular chaperone DnaK